MMSPAMTFSLARDCTNDPVRTKAFQAMMKATPLSYKPSPLQEVNIGYGGVGIGHKEFTSDGSMSYQAALLYWCIDDPTRFNYANLALRILREWATTNKVFKGDNAPLEAAWGICSMARAAELLRYAKDKSVRDEWAKFQKVFFVWVDVVMTPPLFNKDVWRWEPKSNWHYSILCARMQLAILRDNREEFNSVVATYRQVIHGSICVGHKCHISETKRDLTHAQFQLGGVLQVPEMAYHQGVVDLYDPRLHQIIEYHARLMLKEVPEGIRKEDIKTPYGYWHEPVWELGLAHFNGRLKLPMPHTESNSVHFRPERVTFHWGGGTLTHYKRI